MPTGLKQVETAIRRRWVGLGCLLLASVFLAAPAQAAVGGRVAGWGYNRAGQAPGFLGWDRCLSVAGGSYFTLVAQADGEVHGVGENFDGQLSPPPDLHDAVLVKASLRQGLALRRDGTVMAWGGTFAVPADLRDVVALAAGTEHFLALRADGTVAAWGANGSGQCDVPPGLENVVDIAAGASFSFAVRADGSLVGWGDDAFGRVSAAANFSNVIAVAAHDTRLIVLTTTGPIAWGPGAAELAAHTNVQQVACGEDHFLALQEDGTVLAWGGWNQNGQLNVPADLGHVAQISAGAAHSLALVMEPQTPFVLVPPPPRRLPLGRPASLLVSAVGTVPLRYQWQRDDLDLPGATNRVLAWSNPQPADTGRYAVHVSNALGETTTVPVLVEVAGVAPFVRRGPANQVGTLNRSVLLEVFAGGSEPLTYQWRHRGVEVPGATGPTLTLSNLLVAQAGDYVVAISNAWGTIVTEPALVSFHPVVAWGYNINNQSETPADLGDALAAAGGSQHSLALRPDGTVYAWGGWGGGATSVPAGLSNVVEIRARGEGNHAIRADGTVVAWGSGAGPADRLTNVVSLSTASLLGAAVLNDGTVRAWLGPSAASSPLPGLTGVVAVACRNDQLLALRADHSLAAWDRGTALDAWRILDPGPIREVAAGNSHTVVLREDGTVQAWGATSSGQALVPAGLDRGVALAALASHSLALREDGTVVGWGGDSSGESSGGAALTSVVAVGAGEYHSLAIVQERMAPAWVRAPQGRAAASGRDVLWRAAAVGSFPLRYEWFHEGAPIPGATNAYLFLNAVDLSDRGEYRVLCRNAYGVSTSPAAFLEVVDAPPAVVLEPAPRVRFLGGSAEFRVEAVGSVPLEYQWFHGANLLARATNDLLVLRALEATQAGAYSVRVRNEFGETMSREASLSVVQVAAWGDNSYGQATLPPSLTNIVAVAAGANHNLALRADGTVLAWGGNEAQQTNVPAGLSNVAAIAAGFRFSLALKSDGRVVGWGGSLSGPGRVPATVSNIVAIAAASLHAIALREDGLVMGWGGSSILTRLVTQVLTNIVALQVGENVAAYWRADGRVELRSAPPTGSAPPPYASGGTVAVSGQGDTNYLLKADGQVYQWLWSNVGLRSLPAPWDAMVAVAAGDVFVLGLSPDGTVRALGGLQRDRPGEVPEGLSQVVQIAAGYDHALALVAPHAPPRFWQRPHAGTVVQGEDTVLEAGAFGGGPVEYQWLRDGQPILGATDRRLILRQVGPGQAGIYQLQARNAVGSTLSPGASLEVRTAPEVWLKSSLDEAAAPSPRFWADVEPGFVWLVEGADRVAEPAAWQTLTSLLAVSNRIEWTEQADAPAGFRRLVRTPFRPTGEAPWPIPDLVWIPPGQFLLGSPADEPGRQAPEGPQTVVTISRGFFLGRFEVTQALYQSVMGTNPSRFKTSTQLPVHSLKRENAVAFCQVLTMAERDWGRLPADYEYRLPTEAEWEYAARAGSFTMYPFGGADAAGALGEHAWYAANSGNAPHPVGQKRPNAWGLFDMLGNVIELCADDVWAYPGGELVDPAGPSTGTSLYRRGGSYTFAAASCRSASRSPSAVTWVAEQAGFRVVLARRR